MFFSLLTKSFPIVGERGSGSLSVENVKIKRQRNNLYCFRGIREGLNILVSFCLYLH